MWCSPFVFHAGNLKRLLLVIISVLPLPEAIFGQFLSKFSGSKYVYEGILSQFGMSMAFFISVLPLPTSVRSDRSESDERKSDGEHHFQGQKSFIQKKVKILKKFKFKV